MRRKVILFVTLGAFVGLAVAILPLPKYTYKETPLPATFEEFLAQKQKLSADAHARSGNEERLVRYATGQSEIAFLYIHGFGASRAEGEEVLDRVAAQFRANTYYVRLPGHGTNKEDQAKVNFSDYLDAGEEALRMMPLIGKRVIVVGTSMGALIATNLAAEHPDRVNGLIIASPFFGFYRTDANITGYPGGTMLAEMIGGGKIRDVRKKPGDTTDSRIDGYDNYWYDVQYYSALRSLGQLRRAVANSGTYGRVTSPVLMLYYYKDEEHQDSAASVSAMMSAFHQFGQFSKPSPLNRSAAIADGDHILLSKWVVSDKAPAEKEIVRFVKDLQAQ